MVKDARYFSYVCLSVRPFLFHSKKLQLLTKEDHIVNKHVISFFFRQTQIVIAKVTQINANKNLDPSKTQKVLMTFQ